MWMKTWDEREDTRKKKNFILFEISDISTTNMQYSLLNVELVSVLIANFPSHS